MARMIAALHLGLAAALCCQLARAQDAGPPPAPYATATATTTAAPAPAAPAGESRVRLNLDLALVGFTYTKVDKDADEGDQYFAFNFGPLPATRLGLGLGYSPGGPVSFGVNFILGFTVTRPKAADADENDDIETNIVFDYSVLPYIEYAFGTGRVQPFIMAVVGVGGNVNRWKGEGSDAGVDYTYRYTAATTLGVIGFGGGAHFFLADRVSLDLWLVETIGLGALDEEDSQDIDGDTNSEEDTTFVWQSRTELFLGLTGWI